MKVSGDLQFKVLLGAIVLAGAGYVLYRASRAAVDIAGTAAQAVNPFNNDNIINQGATSIYRDVTGSQGTIGTDIYDMVQGWKKRNDEVNEAMREEGFSFPI
jgi:hypothetical protein